LLDGHGVGEVIALCLIAVERLKLSKLSSRFDAFGDHRQMKGMGKGNDRLYNRRVFDLVLHVPNKGPVYFHHIDGKEVKTTQGGIAGAEIVHAQLDAKVTDMLHGIYDFAVTTHHQTFSHFEF
jgi:hypothetical protein